MGHLSRLKPIPDYTRKQHRKLTTGRALCVAGGSAAVLGTGILLNSNSSGSNGAAADIANIFASIFGAFMLTAGIVVLVVGLALISDASKSAAKTKNALP